MIISIQSCVKMEKIKVHVILHPLCAAYFGANMISKLDSDVFWFNEKLQILDFMDNQLTNIEARTFAHMKTLQVSGFKV